MDVLIRYGFTIEEIKIMMNTNDEIGDLDDSVVNELISILEDNDCSESEIKNIFICNPFYLTNNSNSINKLISKLKEIGITPLHLLFNSNPYILNMSDKELDKLYNNKVKEGLSKEEIIDYINYNIIY